MDEPTGVRPSLFDMRLARGHSYLATAIQPGSVIVDAGAHRCEFANAMARRFKARVIALEPNPNLVPEPLESNVKLLRAALAGADGKATLVLDANPEASTIVSDQAKQELLTPMIDVTTRSIDSLFEEFKIESISLLKMDIEGAEFDVIYSLREDIAAKIYQISVEFHPAVPDERNRLKIHDAVCALRRNGFYMNRSSYYGYGDVLFLNSRVFRKPGTGMSVLMPYYRKCMELTWERM